MVNAAKVIEDLNLIIREPLGSQTSDALRTCMRWIEESRRRGNRPLDLYIPPTRDLIAAHRQAIRYAKHVDGDARMFWIKGAAKCRIALMAVS